MKDRSLRFIPCEQGFCTLKSVGSEEDGSKSKVDPDFEGWSHPEGIESDCGDSKK